MKPRIRYLSAGLLAASLAACSSSGDDDPSDPTAEVPRADDGATPEPPATDDPPVNGSQGPADDEPDGTGEPNTVPSTPDPLGGPGAPGSSAQPLDPATRLPSTAGLPEPTLAEIDTFTGPLPTPTADDFFFADLDIDPEPATAGGPPTRPKNLRIDLISNDWAEFSWAPSNDDGEVVGYDIMRSDGHTYEMRRDATHPNGGTQRELDRQWAATFFVDCNYTRFTARVYDCNEVGPAPGDMFSYQVVAIDDAGQRSAPSNTIAIRYPDAVGAPVSDIEDPYLGDNGIATTEDLTNSAYFLDRFELVFEDEFDGDTIDADHWNTQLVWGDSRIINGEQQYFVNTQRGDAVATAYDPFRLEDSVLTIQAIPTPAEVRADLPENCEGPDPVYGNERCLFLSGALSTHDKLNVTYGYVEGRMKASGGAGALSSFYLHHRYEGEGHGFHAPEIDILEYLGENQFGDEDAFQNYHFADTSAWVNEGRRQTRSSPTMSYEKPEGDLYSDDFHTYGVLWEPQLVVWYIDGREVRRVTGPQVGRQGMNIVAYLVAGSAWAPTPDVSDSDLFPLEFQIDWIRAWQRDGYATNGLYPARERAE